MNQAKRAIHGNSIAFIVPEYRPGRCGVFDYSVRMAAGMQALGLEAEVLFVFGESEAEAIRSGGTMVEAKRMTSESVASFDVLAIQYVPSVSHRSEDFRKAMANLRHDRIHLMFHEIWRVATLDCKLTTRERLVAILQRRSVLRIIKALRPKTISCSNRFYQKHLRKAGIQASLSPMPGNIPLGDATESPPGVSIPAFFNRPNDEFIWTTFGSLYTSFWSLDAFFADMRTAQSLSRRPFKWVVAGNQKDEDSSSFRAAAEAYGFGGDIHFTGSAEPEAVDWILRNSDASFNATGRDFWEKSGGTLAAVERGLPVYFPRPSFDPAPCIEPSLYTDLGLLLRNHQASKGYSGSHSLDKSALTLSEILGWE